jgi:peptide/nickel transport system substrate-binding protein
MRLVTIRRLAGALPLVVLAAACGSGGHRPTDTSQSPSPSFSSTGKPGGTLRVVGTVRDVPLDPALARTDPALLVNRLVLRQLYSYRPGDTTPTPDIASGSPKLSSDRLTASISLRPNARWNVPAGRGVTASDVLRGLKRLCAPGVLAPERGYLDQIVVGYADFCAKASRVRLGAVAAPDLDSVDVPGLRAVGDTEVQLVLRRPVADLQQILALPALSPLPVEIRGGFGSPQQFVGDGPYRFADPEPGESYRLSRNPSWDPAGDQVRAALVDRVTFRGGLTPADVQQRLQTNAADLSWDDETPAEVLARPASVDDPGLARVPDRDLALLGVGTKGPDAALLATAPGRAAVESCVDRTALQQVFGGPTVASTTDALLTPDYLDVPPPSKSGSSAAPTPAATGSASPGAGALPGSGSTGSPTAAPAGSPLPSATTTAVPAKPLTVAQCRVMLTLAGLPPGTRLTLLAADSPAEKAAATVLHDRFAAAGLAVQVRLVPVGHYAAATAAGGWDLALLVERPDYAGSRAVLSPLLDPRWPADDRLGTVRRSQAWLTEMAAGLGEERPAAVAERELALASAISQDGAVIGLLRLGTVRTTGPNVGQIPPLVLLGNADPANVALGVTRPGESPSSAPASS